MTQALSRGSFLGTPETAPGPAGPRMLRQVNEIRRDPLGYLHRAWQQYGDIVQFPIPRPPSYLVNDPDAVRRVLVTNARGYGKATIQYRALSLVTGDGLLVADGDAWRHQRQLVQPAFHHSVLENVVGHVNAATERMADQWSRLPSGAVVDAEAHLLAASLEVVGHALFGADLSTAAKPITDATLDALEVVVARARVPITPPPWLPTPAGRRLDRSVRVLDTAVRSIVAERREDTGRTARDMLDLLLDAAGDRGERLSEVEVRDEVVTFIVAGHETVASALTWAYALLAMNPSAAAALADESDAVLGGRAPTMADLAQLPYARAVIEEALRLYPPAWLVTRNALSADVLGGIDVPASALIIMSPWLLHRHPDRWLDAERFEPERFLARDVDRSAYIPYGAGPRQCIGRDFAYLEAVLMLATLAGRFRLEYPVGARLPDAVPSVTLRPHGGMPLRVVHR